ncbi:hypothetical protein Peur_007966 [Populus x canadensis]
MLGFFFTYPFSVCRLLTNILFSWHTSDQNRSPALTQSTAPKNGGKRRTILSTIHLEGSSDRSLLSKLKTILPQKEMSTGRD